MEALLRPCIRDVWHDHVLFSGQQVTGLIDFGAMRVDSIATDIARLVGSLVGDDRRGRRLAIAAYQTINALTRDEERMIGVLDLSTQVIAGLNWVRWLSVENRTFPNPSAMAERIRKILGRLKLTRAANI
jgi:homoserine kinase type II